MRKITGIAVVILILAVRVYGQAAPNPESNWAQWRGPLLTGVAPNANPPLEWSESKNIKWKVEIPGAGYSTPIVWDDMVFIQAEIETEQREREIPPPEEGSGRRRSSRNIAYNIYDFKIMALNRSNGEILWTNTVAREQPTDQTHGSTNWAASSPVTDGEHVYSYFGSRGLYCLDFKGNIIWSRDFGQMEKRSRFGEGSSPALYKDKLVVQWDHEGDSYLYILDKKTGKDIHKIPRQEGTSWSTPLVTEVNGIVQIITSASGKIRSYNLETGELIWESTGMVSNVISHPLVNGDIAYLMSGHRGSALLAVDLSQARGDISGTDTIIWQYNQNTSYTPSPLLLNDRLYFLGSNRGSLSCLDAADGKVNYSSQMLEGTGTMYASPVAANGKIYISGKNGLTYVVKEGEEFEILAKNQLDDGNYASPAIAGNELFIRGFQYLYCIAKD